MVRDSRLLPLDLLQEAGVGKLRLGPGALLPVQQPNQRLAQADLLAQVDDERHAQDAAARGAVAGREVVDSGAADQHRHSRSRPW